MVRMRKLPAERRAAILSALVEGCSIASTCRMFSVNKVTVLRLLADAGTLAKQYHDLVVRGLECERVQTDELWSFVHSKQRNVGRENWGKGYGDAWVWIGMCADSKLVICWTVGGRDSDYARPFMKDLADRVPGRFQLSTDGHRCYLDAVGRAFGSEIDYGMLIKTFAKPREGGPDTRYSPPVCVGARPEVITGNPAREHISTSFIERQNLSLRMGSRRFTRLTHGFSKSLSNHCHALALHFFHFNFIRRHMTIKTTPAVAAGVATHEWTMLDFVKMLEQEEARVGGRLTDYKPAASKKAG